MTPTTNPHIPSQLRQLIYYHLDNNLLRNALFLAGRLVAYEPRNSEAAYLLALCQLQSGQAKAAWDSTRIHASRGTHLGCCYIYAQACLDLGRCMEGITALDRSKAAWQNRSTWNQHSETRRQHLPDAAAVYCLEGKLWQAHKDFNKAVDCWVETLKLNPFMWDAFLGLCEIGVPGIQIPNIYKMNPDMVAYLSSSHASEASSTVSTDRPPSLNGALKSHPTNNVSNIPHGGDPFSSSTNMANGAGTKYGSSALWEKLNGSTVSVASTFGGGGGKEGAETPIMQTDDFDEPTLRMGGAVAVAPKTSWEPPMAPGRKPRSVQDMSLDFGADEPPKMRNGPIKARTKGKHETEDSSVLHVPSLPPAAPAPIDRKRTISGQAAHASASASLGNEPGAPQRRSVRLLNTIRPNSSKLSSSVAFGLKDGRELKKAKATGTKGRSGASTVGRVVSGNRKHMPEGMDIDIKESRPASHVPNGAPHNSHRASASNERLKETEALQSLLELMAKIASGYLALNDYRCQDAIQIFNTLPSQQRETPWVLAQIGRAYYEQASYPEAEKYFIRIKTMAPSRLHDMEVYSTVLWHLKNDVELAFLAHELMEVERLSPQAWCAIGNSFSLQRDHDQALKCFKRATQLDPKFAYGFTLQGHEHVANEEYDKAMDAYRHGLSADSRHYNAWYGLGKVYEKMGKYDFAETHYRRAARINPTNAVLICCIGVVMEKLKNPEAALMLYSQACTLAPQSALSRFKKARCLMGMGEPKLALVELKILKDIAPDEANVHFLLGRLYKMLHEKANAIKHFTTALNLDPKAAQYIKDAMESLDEDDDDDDADGDMS